MDVKKDFNSKFVIMEAEWSLNMLTVPELLQDIVNPIPLQREKYFLCSPKLSITFT